MAPRRNSLSSTLLGVALLAPVAVGSLTLLAPATAQAQSANDPLVEMLPAGDIVGDGASKVTLHFLALNPDGSAMTGLTGKLTVGVGNVEGLTEVRPGLYRTTWTPPSVTTAQVVDITFKGKNAAKAAVNRAWKVTLTAPAASQITAVASPNQLILGQDTTATLSVQLVGDQNAAATQNDIVLLPSAGTVTNVTPLGQGRYSALYTAPPQQFPQMATITIADRRDPSRTFGVLVIPLVGRANFPVTGLPNSRVLLKVGDREFGPMQADAAGRVQVPIMVPPGVSSATVISITDAKTQQDPLDLQIPPSQRVRMFPVHQAVPADSNLAVPVRAYVGMPVGGPDVAAKVTFSTTAGTVTPAVHEGNGVYRTTFAPPFGNTSAQATIQVNVEDARGKQSDGLTVNLIPARPSTVTVTAEPPVLPPGASQMSVFAKIAAPNGVGLTGRDIAITADGAKVTAKAKDLGNGDYQVILTPSGNGPIQLTATAKSPASGNALRRVILFPSRPALPNDGLSGTPVTIVTLDEFGYPVANVPVSLSLSGEGSIPASVTTDESGLAQVNYTAGRAAGLVRVNAKAGNVGGATAIQLAMGVTQSALLEQGSGTQATLDAYAAWRKIVTELRVDRQGGGAMVAAPVRTPVGPAGPAAALKLTADPANATPGTVVTLKITVNDANGQGKSGQPLEFIASAGAVGAVQDLGNGQYQTSLTVPIGITGEIKVSASTPDGAVSGFLKIPVAAAAATGWGVATAPTPAPAPTPVAAPTPPAAPKEPKAPRPPTDMDKYPWLRLSGGYMGGMYSYLQTSEALNGPIFPQDIAVGGGVTDPAGMAGLAIHGRAWLPKFRYVGVETRLDAGKWAIAFDESSGVAAGEVPDWLTELRLTGLARYPFMLSDKVLAHVGARAGLSMNDYLVFTKEGEDLVWANELTTHLHVGGELGAEFGEKAFANIGAQMYLADTKDLYGAALELEVGVAPITNLFVSLSGGLTGHNHGIYLVPDDGGEKALVGNNQDSLTWFGLNVGYQR